VLLARTTGSRDLLLALPGAHRHQVEGTLIRTERLIRLLGDLGMTQNSSQVYLTRLAKAGLVSRRSSGRSPGVALTPAAERLLGVIEDRTREFGQPTAANGTFTMIWYSLPKSARAARSRLVQELRMQGFGSLQDSTWLAMRDRRTIAQTTLDELRLAADSSVLVGPQSEISNVALLLERGWDLRALRQAYEEFLQDYGDYATPSSISDRDAFVTRVQMLEEFKAFFSMDPESDDLDDIGELRRQATTLFWAAYNALAPGAEAHFAEVALSPDVTV